MVNYLMNTLTSCHCYCRVLMAIVRSTGTANKKAMSSIPLGIIDGDATCSIWKRVVPERQFDPFIQSENT